MSTFTNKSKLVSTISNLIEDKVRSQIQNEIGMRGITQEMIDLTVDLRLEKMAKRLVDVFDLEEK